MEEVLKEIQIVKWLLIGLISIFGLIFLTVVYAIYKTEKHFKQNQYVDFSSIAKDLLDKGLPDEVIQKAKSRIATHPKDKWAHWYLA